MYKHKPDHIPCGCTYQLKIICDWVWENPAFAHNYEYLEIPNSIIWSRKGSRCLHEICHDSIAIYNLSTHQLLGE